jgi:alkylhydroperoxidase/carboxymuconolactone decarboxylase family protein YurZ
MNAEALERCRLDERSGLVARLAALVAVDAPVSSYLLHVGPVADIGMTLEDIQGVLLAIAPIVGGPKVVSAAVKITDALGIAVVAADEAEAAARRQ